MFQLGSLGGVGWSWMVQFAQVRSADQNRERLARTCRRTGVILGPSAHLPILVDADTDVNY